MTFIELIILENKVFVDYPYLQKLFCLLWKMVINSAIQENLYIVYLSNEEQGTVSQCFWIGTLMFTKLNDNYCKTSGKNRVCHQLTLLLQIIIICQHIWLVYERFVVPTHICGRSLFLCTWNILVLRSGAITCAGRACKHGDIFI